MKKLCGFTLSELMIALGVLGILCAAVIPAIVNNMPNQNKIMMKRVYYNTTNIVKDMINNSDLYSPYGADNNYIGFDNTNSVTYFGKTYSGATKFPDIFIYLLNKKGDVSSSTDYCKFTTSVSNCITVNTSDGMRWTFAVPSTVGQSTWINNPDSVVSHILVDVNGDRKPNCYQGNEKACKTRTKNFDQFRMTIYTGGKVKIDSADTWAKNAIDPNSSINDDD